MPRSLLFTLGRENLEFDIFFFFLHFRVNLQQLPPLESRDVGTLGGGTGIPETSM